MIFALAFLTSAVRNSIWRLSKIVGALCSSSRPFLRNPRPPISCVKNSRPLSDNMRFGIPYRSIPLLNACKVASEHGASVTYHPTIFRDRTSRNPVRYTLIGFLHSPSSTKISKVWLSHTHMSLECRSS